MSRQHGLRSRGWLVCLCLIVSTLLLAIVVNVQPVLGTESNSAVVANTHPTPTPTPTPSSPPYNPASASSGAGGAPLAMMTSSVPATNSVRGYRSLVAEYYDEKYLAGTQVVTTGHGGPIDFDLKCSSTSPYTHCKLHNALPYGADYSVRWEGELVVPRAGIYTFRLDQVDDAAQLFVDDTLIADKSWRYDDGLPDVYGPVATLTLTVGIHDIIVDYT